MAQILYALYALTLPNINRFSKLFHCQNQEKIYNKIPPHLNCVTVLHYRALQNHKMSLLSVLNATTENKTASVTTDFKNNMKQHVYCLSYCPK